MKQKTLWFLILILLLSPLMLTAQEDPLPPGLYARFLSPSGALLYRLDYEQLPRTVSNFVALAEGKMKIADSEGPYYTNQKIYREVQGYALFLGDPDTPVDYTIPREKGSVLSSGTPGSLVMVSRQNEDQGSQIMIMINGDPFLDQKYTTFGQLITGEKTLSKLKRGDIINSVEIIRIGSKAESFSPDDTVVRDMIMQARIESRQAFADEYPEVALLLDQLGDGVEESETGIFFKIINEGKGGKPRPGNTVRMHYSGRLLSGEEFDNSYMRGEPFQFVIGRDGVIPGWIETALSMQAGEKRTIILPPALAYGEKGYGPIPPGSWLIFDIELIDFQ
ncbi:FKBP-type peptidyl-prolyl cis-trans isomerase [Oceanispirochaeta sp.]|jgi:FKBP-type peptidyl-prolyl cis-trans isomerase|uniref:FKBP-type peptidyl-prolyl cis-trans isomerase n=1 Tax=Oceanispirochaeta sp. TaxID=2035350 RepID=UPI002603EBC3|nr:FKBP-type peptidyl-prolyl cis-trans isomerase [Oceanispirochaeta sp.]MDA3956474.1 FKBP-type peptidyl-prolyl cis-trans isomerase [Oceanispirochaeta sp.]